MPNPDLPSALSPREEGFLSSLSHWLSIYGKRNWLGDLLQIDREAELSAAVELSGVQDAALFRARRRAVLLSEWIIDEEGVFQQDRLLQCSEGWAASGHFFYARGRSDKLIHEHIGKILNHFALTPALIKQIQRFSHPLCHTYAERIIRLSLFLPHNHALQNCHIRRAVFAASLTFLRQSIGSCFATAPALLIQSDQIDYFLTDLYELLATGRLKRTFEGNEHSVPLSPSFGMGDLRRNIGFLLDRYPIFLSPGLLAACRASLLLSEEWPHSKQVKQIQKWLEERKDIGKAASIIDFFETLFLETHGVSRDEWGAFQTRQKLPRRQMIQGTSSPRDLLCEKISHTLQVFNETFVSFVDHPLLKAWEFTLASFSESKAEFSRWNLYASLGLDPEEEGGIGALIAQEIDKRLGDSNSKIKELQQGYEVAFDEVRATEALLKRADSHEKARRLQAEYQSRVYHMNSLLEMRDEIHHKGGQYTGMLKYLIEQYDLRFPQFFQEIYDAEMFDIKAGPYQDSVAGFRLVYKHGRNDPSQWTMITSSEQYIECLIDFFKMTEGTIVADYPHPAAANEISRLTDLIIAHVHSSLFLETAMARIKRAYLSDHLDPHSTMIEGGRTPWAYISGGTMETLLKFYYRYPGSITKEGRWVENTEDLLIFFLDALKSLPLAHEERFAKNRNAGMLMNSPNHAVILYPGVPGFFAGWQENTFSYTWVRDRIVHPSRDFFAAMTLTPDEQLFLIDEWGKGFPLMIQHQLTKVFIANRETRTVAGFVQTLASYSNDYLKLGNLMENLDSFLYEMLPLCPGERWKENVLLAIPEKWREGVSRILTQQPDDLYGFIGSRRLQELAKAFILLLHSSIQTSVDIHELCAHEARLKKIAPPSPLFFADTNWPHFYFAFVWGAASGRLQLWRMDTSGIKGVPMSEWEAFLRGDRQRLWAIYPRLEQYS